MYYINKRFPKWGEPTSNGIIVPKIHREEKNFRNSIYIDGMYKFYSIKNGVKKQVGEAHNTIMTDVFYRIVRAFLGYSFNAYYYIMHCAIGDDNTAVTASDTTLTNEVFRTAYVAIENTTTTTVNATFYITSDDYVGSIEEIGVFGGGSSTDSADTGNLISHALWDYDKTINEELLIEYVITLS